MSIINLHNMDCMEAMAGIPDKCFDLAIVDPPYGIERFKKGGSLISIYGNPGRWNESVPTEDYFNQLFRITENLIIFGGNYFTLPVTGAWIFWDKAKNTGTHGNFADGELAWTSFNRPLKKICIPYDGFVGADTERIHPTQKPVALYRWLLDKYAKPGDKILDTHGGSMSIAIACYDLGYDLELYEIDEDYFKAGKERLERYQAQGRLF
jgi:site-specific DNA-methyltransferase (adenine-specific)